MQSKKSVQKEKCCTQEVTSLISLKVEQSLGNWIEKVKINYKKKKRRLEDETIKRYTFLQRHVKNNVKF